MGLTPGGPDTTADRPDPLIIPSADLAVQSSDCLAAFEWVRDGEMERELRKEGKLAEGSPGIDGSRIAALGYSCVIRAQLCAQAASHIR